MSFIKPMLASALPEGFIITPGCWSVETKYDGHRLIVQVTDGKVQAWARSAIPRILPTHIVDALAKFPVGIYDGELLVPGHRSYGVTELTNSLELVYTVFDVLELLGTETMSHSYDQRRSYLEEIFSREHLQSPAVVLAQSQKVDSMEDVNRICAQIWAEDGEGVILKRRKARYYAGKRSKDFLKVKQLLSAVLRLTGFVAGKGEKVYRGVYATMALVDSDGNKTTIKTRDDAMIAELERVASTGVHPYIGRGVVISYQERTPDGNYRHPRFKEWMK